MSVENSIGVQRLPWAGHEAAGLPSGMWRASNTVVMDASGGNAEAKIVFQFAADPLQGLVYHLGQAWVTVSGAAGDVNFVLKTASMGYAGVAFALAIFGTLTRLALTNEANVRAEDARGLRGHLLGMPVTTGDDATLEVIVPNVDGDVLLLTTIGYVWSQLAIGQAGAPRLPDGALWG